MESAGPDRSPVSSPRNKSGVTKGIARSIADTGSCAVNLPMFLLDHPTGGTPIGSLST